MSNYKDETKYSSLAKILTDTDYVVIDTCSLMEDSFPEWLDILVETKEEYLDSDVPIYVLESSVKELERHASNKESIDKKIAAKRALRVLKKSKRHREIDYLKVGMSVLEERPTQSEESEEAYAFADVEILALINVDHVKKKIVAITQDKKLASDILGLNHQQSSRGRPIRVYKLDENAVLVPNEGEAVRKPAKVRREEPKKASEPKAAAAPAKSAAKPKKTKDENAELTTKILNMDNKIRSTMANTTYSTDKKIADLKSQLAVLEALDKKSPILSKVKFDIPALKAEIIRLENPETPSPAPIAEKPKSLPYKPAAPAQIEKKQKKDLWYEYGQTVEDAFRNVGNHYGVVFRDPKVPYVPNVHGPVNFTSDDLSKIAATFGNTLKEGQKIVKQYRTVLLMAEKTPKGIKAWLDIDKTLIPYPASSKAPVVEKPAEEKPAKTVKETAKKPAKTEQIESVSVQNNEGAIQATPSGASLVVGEPTAKKEKGKSSKKEASKSVASQPEPSPKKAPAKKPAPAKTPTSPTNDVPAATKPKKPTKLEEAIAADARLKANIHNQNYPKEQKVKDIEEQIVIIKKIPLKDRGALNFGLDSLKALLALLQ